MPALDDTREQLISRLLAERGLRGAQRPVAERSGARSGPLSPGQQRLWLLEQLHPGEAQYTVPMVWRVTGSLDEAALRRALRELCLRHEPLRTVFRRFAGEPRQVVLDDVPPLLVEDLRHLPSQDRDRAADAAVRALCAQHLDLAAEAPVRLRLYRHGDSRWTLAVVCHHIVIDDWSTAVFRSELRDLYRGAAGLSDGGALSALPVSYIDWAAGEQRAATGAADDLTYWSAHLDGAPTAVDLPTVGTAGQDPGLAATVTVPVDEDDLTALRAAGQAAGCTWFMVLLAAWAALLSRVADQADVVVGTPAAQRGGAGARGLIGYFLNTLALRVDVSGDPSLHTLLARARSTALDAYRHAAVPFDHVVRALQPDRSLSRHPLFQVWLATDETDPAGFDLPGTTCTAMPADGATAKFDLALFAARRTGGTELVVEYDTARFAPDTVARLARQLGRLLHGFAARPDAALSAFDLLDPGERERVLHTWNDAAAGPRRERSAHSLFERHAALHPDAVAAVMGDDELTYAALDRHAEAVAAALRQAELGGGDHVGVAVGRSFGMLAAVLGVLKAGAAYVPLDLSHPPERISLILQDSGVRAALVDPSTMGRLPGGVEVRLDVTRLPAPDGPAAARAAVDPGATAYVTYTSGSTGRPKGIAMPHRAVSNLIDWQLGRYGPHGRGSRTLQFASLSFDVSFQEIFLTLSAGGTLVLVPDETRRDVQGLPAVLEKHRVERLFLPSVALQQFAEGCLAGGPLPTALRTVIAGSEQLVVTDDLVRLFAALPRCRLHNEYGPSETHVATAFALPDEPADWPSWVPVGRPVANARAYVLDGRGRPVPVGTRGEIHIGGAGLAHGYVGRPALTATAFGPDPFGPEPGARMYRTGDIGRFLPDGTLEFLGRADSQVKIRGFRVELGEVRTALEALDEVRASHLRVVGETSAQRRIVAYVVPADGGGGSAAGLRQRLRAALPEHMVPSAFVLLAQFPLTVNGKVDERRLPEPGTADRDTGTPFVAPRDDIERAVAEEFRKVLAVAEVGAEDDFMRLGGHSLLATRLLWEVQTRFGVALSTAAFFREPTVAALAGQITAARSRSAAPAPDDDAGQRRLDALFDDMTGD